MTTRRPILAAAAALLLGTGAASQSLYTIPDFEIHDVAEGPVVSVSGHRGGVAARATVLGTTLYPGADRIVRTSANGQVHAGKTIVGTSLHATRYTSPFGWTPLPQPAGTVGDFLNPTDMSADGLTIVGSAASAIPLAQNYVGWRWTASGGTELFADPLAVTSEAHCISADGSWVGGTRRQAGQAASRAVRWDAFGSPWGVLPNDFPGVDEKVSVLATLNADGTQGAGRLGIDLFIWDVANGAFLVDRPADAGSFNFIPSGMADDGSLVAGVAINTSADRRAWYWTPGEGIRWVDAVAAQLELDPSDVPVPFTKLEACSADGLRLGGSHDDSQGVSNGWVLDLPAGGVGRFVDAGKALPGETAPRLEGFGSLGGGTEVTLRLTDVKPVTTCHLVIGLSALLAPFKGGVMVPDADLVVSFPVFFGSLVDIDLDWPVGLPASTSLWFQAWQQQGNTPHGWASTNGLQAITP